MESRRGVALAEVVIALVVITIISVATLSVMFSSVQIENKTIVAMMSAIRQKTPSSASALLRAMKLLLLRA